jgi:hypothetical protein
MDNPNVKVRDADLAAFLALVFAAGKTPKIKGPPGIGKSKGVEQYAKDQGDDYGYFEIDMSKANIGDFQGFLMPREETMLDADGNSMSYMAGRYTYPYWAYDKFSGRPLHMFKRGVVVFEEWGQGDPEVKRASAPMIYERRLGLYHFPGFDCVMLSNRPEDRSGTTKEYDFIINRTTEVTLQPTLDHFLMIGTKLGFTPLTMAFAARNEAKLFTDPEVPKSQGPWMTQRSLHAADDLIKTALSKGMPLESPLLLVAMAGTIGFGNANAYMEFVKCRTEIPTLSKIVADPMSTPVPTRLDLLTFLVFDIAAKATHANIGALATYVKRMSDGMGVMFFNAVTRRDPTMVSTAEFSSFAKDNLTLLSAVAMRR